MPSNGPDDCPLCHDMDAHEQSVSEHLRRRCPAVLAWREDVGLPPEGYDATWRGGDSVETPPREDEGNFAATAGGGVGD